MLSAGWTTPLCRIYAARWLPRSGIELPLPAFHSPDFALRYSVERAAARFDFPIRLAKLLPACLTGHRSADRGQHAETRAPSFVASGFNCKNFTDTGSAFGGGARNRYSCRWQLA